MKKGLVSIIIVNYNGLKWLESCFKSLQKQTYSNFEIILVDNNSKDESVAYIEKNFPQVKLIRNKNNDGFAGGNNLGYHASQGEYIVLLNNDTTVEPNYLKHLLAAFDEIPHLGCAQSKLILMNDREHLDVVGAYWTDSSFLYYYGLSKKADLKKYNQPMPFFSIKGASVIFKREVIEEVGLFDDDFWCYYEETDLCHRLWLSGYECWYWPQAVCYHANGGTSLTFGNDFIQFHNFKNKLMSMIKNFSGWRLLYIIPEFILLNVLLSFYWLFTGKFKHFLTIYKAIGWNVRNLKVNLRKRALIQEKRKITDHQLFKKTKKNPRLNYYFYLLINQLNRYHD